MSHKEIRINVNIMPYIESLNYKELEKLINSIKEEIQRKQQNAAISIQAIIRKYLAVRNCNSHRERQHLQWEKERKKEEEEEEDRRPEYDDDKYWKKEEERVLKVVLKNSNCKFKKDPEWQKLMFKLYLENGSCGPDYLPVFERFIAKYLNKSEFFKNTIYEDYEKLKKKLDEYTMIETNDAHQKQENYFPCAAEGGRRTFKHYLKVPYNDKEQAKRLGAKWDKNKKKWYYICPNDNYICLERRWGRLSNNGMSSFKTK